MKMINVLNLFIPLLFTQANSLTPTYVEHWCPDPNFSVDLSQDTSYAAVPSLLSNLTLHSSTSTFYSTQSISGQTTSYGLFYCTANVNFQDCQACVQSAVGKANLYCPFVNQAVIFYKECTLRYSNTTISATPDESVWAWYYSSLDVSYSGFNSTLYSKLTQLIPVAAVTGSSGFATGESSLVGTSRKLQTLAQCTPDILGSDCQQCLEFALEKMPMFCEASSCLYPQREFIFTYLPSCQLTYQVGSSPSGVAGKCLWCIVLALLVVGFALH